MMASATQRVLSVARSPRRRSSTPLSRTERLLLVLVSAHLCFLPWALGDMHVWSQFVSLLFSVISLGVALAPRNPDSERRGSALLRQPIFWIGAALLAYILVQALNPAWRYESNDRYWWLARAAHVEWLPSGIATPLDLGNPWRYLMIYGSAWMTVCAISTGFTRGRTVRILLSVLACNAFLLALLGLLERCTRADAILWLWRPPAYYFVSSFIYKNHAGAYFNLMMAICAGLTVCYHERSRQLRQKSSPSVLFAFFAATLALIVVFSYSRAATILMLCYLFFVFAQVGLARMQSPSGSQGAGKTAALVCAVIAGFGLIELSILPTGQAIERMDALIKGYHLEAPDSRRLATRATLDMARVSPAYGWGAGSFRFAFPAYQRAYPPLLWSEQHKPLLWEHAHDDYAELLSELGIAGTSLIALGALYYSATLIRLRFWENRTALFIAGGCLVTLVHSYGDFNFYNPAVLITWCACWPLLVRLLEAARFP
jgi:hypothetical protein